jgi:hypothetical protein
MNLNDLVSPLLPLRYWLLLHAFASFVIAASLLWLLVRGFEISQRSIRAMFLSLLLRATVWLIVMTAIASAGAAFSVGAAAFPINVIQDLLFAVVMLWVVISHEKFIYHQPK